MADFLDELTQDDMKFSAVDEIMEQQRHALDGNVGDVCYYDIVNRKFELASLKDTTKMDVTLINDWKTIVIGVALNQQKDKGTFDILMSGFLMAQPLLLPFGYARKEKQPYIRAYAYKMFQRFVKAFFK